MPAAPPTDSKTFPSVSQQPFSFEINSQQGRARAGKFSTPHGQLLTPAFAPVGTQATVKAITPAQLEELGVEMILANTYHLYLRPGDDAVAQLGGLHRFMSWPHPILTDSGGFQIFSLAENRKVTDEGVTFRSHIDGSTHLLTPEKSIAIQENLGADIIMAFDECAAPYDREYLQQAVGRTHAWARRCLETKTRSDQALFGIVQGGVFPDLRENSARYIASLGFPGNAIGGLSVGETKQEMHAMLELVDSVLPEDKPRYLMGVGSPEDLVNGVLRGIDLFDCVLPTRLARHTAAFSPTERLNLMNSTFAKDPSPIQEGCGCYTCRNFTRAYLRHLIVAKEMLAATLVTIHNLHFILDLMRQMRMAIFENRLENFVGQFFTRIQIPLL